MGVDLKLKSEVFSKFQNFLALEEKDFGCRITTLRSDNAGVFCSNAFNNFSAKHGIKRQYNTPYTPQQNGVLERRNHTITKMAKSMMQNKSITTGFRLRRSSHQ